MGPFFNRDYIYLLRFDEDSWYFLRRPLLPCRLFFRSRYALSLFFRFDSLGDPELEASSTDMRRPKKSIFFNPFITFRASFLLFQK